MKLVVQRARSSPSWELGVDPGPERAKAKAQAAADKLTLAVVCDRYLEVRKPVVRPNTFAANRPFVGRGAFARPGNAFAWRANAWRGNALAWRGRGFDRFHHRRFAFFPAFVGFGGLYDYAGSSCYYDPNASWTYDYYGYDNCYPYSNSSYSYGWGG